MLDDLRVGALYGLLAAMAVIALLCGGALWYCLHMPGWSHSGDLPPALPEEIDLASHLRRHVIAIASRPHNVRHYEALPFTSNSISSGSATRSRRRPTRSTIA